MVGNALKWERDNSGLRFQLQLFQAKDALFRGLDAFGATRTPCQNLNGDARQGL